MDKYTAYRQYNDIEQVDFLVSILEENKIPYEVKDNTSIAPDALLGQNTSNKFIVKISPNDFITVNSLLEVKAQDELDTIDKDYHLFSFNNEELIEIIAEPDSWCELDRKLAKKILKDRDIEISDTLEKTLYNKRIEELSRKEEGNIGLIIVGYISSLLGGLLGIAIGLTLWTYKRTLPNGERVYVYKDNDRLHGMIISLSGIIAFFLCLLYCFIR